MAIKIEKLPLFGDLNYKYSVSLEQNTYTISLLYLERLNDWVMTLKDSDQTTLMSGKVLTPLDPIALSYRIPNLTGFFYLEPRGGKDPSEIKSDKRFLKDHYNFYYIYDDGA